METKTKATLLMPFYYLISPLIAIANGEDMQTTNDKIWFRLNDLDKKDNE